MTVYDCFCPSYKYSSSGYKVSCAFGPGTATENCVLGLGFRVAISYDVVLVAVARAVMTDKAPLLL